MGNCIISKANIIKNKLIWVNTSPGQPFSSQKISLDLSNLSYIAIMMKLSTSSNTVETFFCRIGSNFISQVIDSGSYPHSVQRSIDVSADGINFGEGHYDAQAGNNSFCVPSHIYSLF